MCSSSCECKDCINTEANSGVRTKKMQEILARRPDAFEPRRRGGRNRHDAHLRFQPGTDDEEEEDASTSETGTGVIIETRSRTKIVDDSHGKSAETTSSSSQKLLPGVAASGTIKDLTDQIGPGWKMSIVPRKSSNKQKDYSYFGPDGQRFRSMKAAIEAHAKNMSAAEPPQLPAPGDEVGLDSPPRAVEGV